MAALLAASLFSGCLFSSPVDGPMVRPFAPEGPYRGHWGVDLAVPVGTPVRSIAPGIVTFSGTVAGRRSVTVTHGGSLRSSYSYLTEIRVPVGQAVDRTTVLGTSGIDHGIPALHLSVRIAGLYVDPLRLCGGLVPALALRLAG